MSERRRSRSRDRDRGRDRDSQRSSHSHSQRDRDRDRDRDKHRDGDRARPLRHSPSRDRDVKRRRSRSPQRPSRHQQQDGTGSAPKPSASEATSGDAALKEKQRLRQQKMAALLGKQNGTEAKPKPEPVPDVEPASFKKEPEYWAPWEAEVQPDVKPGLQPDPVSYAAAEAAPAQPPVQLPASVLKPSVIEAPFPENDEGVDPLDAFMDAEVMPEVQDREREEKDRRDAARQKFAQQMVTGTIPKLSAILEDSDEEEEPDAIVVVPHKKVKLVVGPGGEKIKHIQHKSKCRLQIKKEEKELTRAFGTSAIQAKIDDLSVPQEGRTATIMLFGNARECEVAQAMIEEAIENKEQKAKQRAKEYERKREAKWRNRQMYHMRHTRDYEALGLPIGASKVDVKAAYKKLAVQWHPDKHPEDPEGAKANFQEVQRAYTALMTTDEDEIIAQLAAKKHKESKENQT